MSFTTVGWDAYFLINIGEGTIHAAFENHVRTGVGELDFWNRTGKTEIWSPILGWRSS
jgi:hypothetical protein